MRTLLLTFLLILSVIATGGLSQSRAQQPAGKELTKLREEFLKATIEYRASLEQLRASYQKNVQRAQQRLVEAKELRARNLFQDSDIDAAVRTLGEANEKVKEGALVLVYYLGNA